MADVPERTIAVYSFCGREPIWPEQDSVRLTINARLPYNHILNSNYQEAA